MKRIFKLNIKKIIASLTATSLLISFVVGPTAASALNSDKNEEYKQIFKEFVLPYSYGKITNAHYAGTDRVIINIQDLHCHPKVQKNISNIIESFDKKFGVNKIYLEGAYGKVNTSWINDKINNNKEVLEKMLDTGRLTGAEYYSSLSGKTEIIEGLEEKEPYLDNIKRLGDILQEQGSIDLILKSLHKSVNNVKKKYYTKRQYKLEQLFNQYKEGKITSQKYYTLLSKHIDKLGIDLTKYENSLIYLTLLELQKELNYKKVTVELQSLISLLKQQVPYNVYKELLENTSKFQEVEKLYSYIIQLDKIYNFDISSNYKELDKYFRYIELSKKINPVELVKEDEFLLQEINTRFSQTKAQKDVVFLVYFEKYLKDFLTTKITLDDYQYYKENIDKYITIYNKYVDNRVLSLLNDYIAQTDKFYNINMDRNTYFAQNMFNGKEPSNKLESEITTAKDDVNKIMDNIKNVKKIDVVITGGFHSQTVTEMIKDHDVSYIVITPNVYDGIKLAEDTYYELAKEQSKLSFQTIAPVIASLSPQLQKMILEKAGNVNQEETAKISDLDDIERAKIISELVAANLLESDDTGNVEEKLQDVIKSVVDDLHKEKVTPELVSKIKNLQSLLKDKEKLQKVIDLLSESATKQSVILVINIFDGLYEQIFDILVSFADKERLGMNEDILPLKDFDTDEVFEDIEKDGVYENDEYYGYDVFDSLELWFSDAELIELSREIIKEGQYNENIEKFIEYLGRHNMADYELLSKILAELKAINNSEIKKEYCGVLYALTDKKVFNGKQKIVKTKEDIVSFLEKPKTIQLRFCELFPKVFAGHDDIIYSFFTALLDCVNEKEYTDKDFDFLVTICRYSFLVTDLETKENMYNFLTLNVEKRRLLYSFYQAPKVHTDIDINRVTLNFMLSVLHKYNLTDEQFNYIMKLICSVNITKDTFEQKYVNNLKEKELNIFVLENFKYVNYYSRYLLDLIFSDVEETKVENFVSKLQKIVDLFDDLQEYKIDTLDTENKCFALELFLNYGFETYCKDNNINDIVKQYQLAIRVSRKIYSILGDKIFTTPIDKMDNIIKKTLEYYKKIDKIISFLTLFTNKTAIFSLHNNERNSDKKSFRFTPDGIKEILKRLEIEPEVFEAIEISFMDKVLDFIKKIEQDEIDKQVLLDFVNNLDGSVIVKKDILEYLTKKKTGTISKKSIIRYVTRLKISERFVEVNRYLKLIEHFNDYGQEKGVFIFDGHGASDGKSISYSETGSVTVNQIAQALINAHNNGVNLETLTLVFASCHSYKFADNIINELIKNGIDSFPQILTDAGKETIYGYTKTVDMDGKQTKVSNLFYSLLKFLDSKTQEEREQMKGSLYFKDVADAPRYLSNNTVFITNKEINKLNHELETDILGIINEQNFENIETAPVNNDVAYAGRYRLYAEMMLPSTQKTLNKIGNIGIIKTIYKEKSGENFRFTTLGIALGVLIETFSFWSPNFIKAHNFDPSIQSGMIAVVWAVRALSIGLGFGVGSIWALLLTETITHFIWNITVRLTGRQDLLLQISQEKSQIEKTTTQEQQSVSQQKWTMSNISKEAPYTEKYKLVYYIFEKTCRQMDIEFPEEQEFIIINNIIDAYDSSFWEIMDFENWVYEHFITDIIDFQQKQSRLTDALSKCFPDDIEDILWIFSQCLSKSKVPMFILNNIIDVANDLEKINNIHFSEEVYAVLNILKRYNTSETEQILVNIGLIKVPNALYKKAMDDIEFKQLEEEIIENENGKMIVISELQLPFTQKVLNKIGNSGIIKSIYKEKSGDNFRFTKLGVAIGVLLETIAFWMPNFVKAHNFDPSIQTKMTAVVWVIRALSIGLGFGVGSIWALLLTETITHYIWNRLSIRAGKKNLLLQTSENLTKEQLIQKIFDVSNIDRDYKENIEDKQKLESLLNKEQIFETDIKFVLQEKDFITDDSLLNYQKINFFFKVLNLVREKGFNVDDDLYEQIMFLMDVFTYEQSLGPISYTIISDPEVMDIENAVLRFFNLNSERRQQICDNLEDPTLDAFALMLKSVEECEKAGCTEQETDELLMLINDSRNVMEEYYFKDFERALLNIRNLRLYIEQKNKLLNKRNPLYVTSFLSMGSAANSPLWLSVIYSNININSLIGNDNDKTDNLIKLIKELERAKIRKLDTEYGGLTLRIFLNKKFRSTIVKQYMMESMAEGRNKKPTILNIYRIAQKISRTLYEIMGVNISMLSEQDLNNIMETLVRDNARRRSVAKKTEFVSENTGVVAIHNMELGKNGSRRFSMIGTERIMSMLGITPKLVTDFIIKDKKDIKNKADRWLESIENFLDALEQNGLTGIRYVFDGHGSSNGLYLIGNGMDIDDIINGTDIYDHISVKEVAESLFKAYKKCVEQGKGEKFESLILDLSSCHSYEFAKKVIDELKQLEEQAGLPLRFPQIITEAGKETELGYSATYGYNTEKLLISNMEASLLIYIQAEISKGRDISSLTLQDLFDAQIYMSNHTIFVSSPEIETLNKTLRENLTKILRKGLVPEEGQSAETDVLIDIEPDQGERLPSVVTELQLSSTQKILGKIGNLGIIKAIYKDKAGANFRYTKLGVAIGTIVELFSFWSPNFIKAHNFDPSIQARMTAVVWVIRALSIGLGLGAGVAFAVSFGPLAFLLGIPALFLTETIVHSVWNIFSILVNKGLLLQAYKEIRKYAFVLPVVNPIPVFVEVINTIRDLVSFSKENIGAIYKNLSLKEISKNLYKRINKFVSALSFLDPVILITAIFNLFSKGEKTEYTEQTDSSSATEEYNEINAENETETENENQIEINDEDRIYVADKIQKFSKYLTKEQMEYIAALIKNNEFVKLRNLLDKLDNLILENPKLQLILRNNLVGDNDFVIRLIFGLCFDKEYDEINKILDSVYLLSKYAIKLSTILSAVSVEQLFVLSDYIEKQNNPNINIHLMKIVENLVSKQVDMDKIIAFLNFVQYNNVPLLKISVGFDNNKIDAIEKFVALHPNRISKENFESVLSVLGNIDSATFVEEKNKYGEEEVINIIIQYVEYRKQNNNEHYEFSKFLADYDEIRLGDLIKQKFNNVDSFTIEVILDAVRYTGSIKLINELLNANIMKTIEDLDSIIFLLESLKDQRIAMNANTNNNKYKNIATENQNIVFAIFLSDEFKEEVNRLSKESKYSYLKNPIHQYKLAIAVGRRITQDCIKAGKIVNPQAKDFNKIVKLATAKQLELTERQMDRVLINSSAKIIGINNNELKKNSVNRRFTFKELNVLLDKIKGNKRNKKDEVLIDCGIGKEEVEKGKKDYLDAIAQLSDKDKNAFIFFNGHGNDDILALGNRVYISVEDLGEALIVAHEKGMPLDKIFIDLSACHSYTFARKLEQYLNRRYDELGVPEKDRKYPVILTAAGYETPFGYDARPTDSVANEFGFNSTEEIGNEWVGLLSVIRKEDSQTPLKVGDLVRANIRMANHAVFVYDATDDEDTEIIKLIEGNDDFENLSQKFDLNTTNIFFRDNILPKGNFELQLSSTQKILEKIGNLGIIKAIYKEKAGSNFRFTKLGVAIGAIIELFSFWSPNFIKAHDFDPSMQTRMTAVVWVIRALSIGLGAGTGVVFAVSFGPLAFLLGIPALFLTETIAHFIWNFLAVKIEQKAISLQTSKKNNHSVNGIFIKLVSIVLTVFLLMLGGYGIASSVENTDVINIQQMDMFNDSLDQMSNKDYQKLIDELGVDGINQLLNRVKNENKREEAREQFARYITDSQYVELLLQSIKDGNYKEFFKTFDPTYNKLIKGNLGNMRAGAKEYETIMDNLGIEGVSKIILSIDDGEIKTAVVNDIIKNKYDYFLADALSKDKLDLFFDILDSDYSHLLSMNSTETNCLLLNYFSGFNDLEVLLDYFEKNNKSEITSKLIDKYNTELMNMYYVDLFCKAIKEGKKEEFLSLFKDREAVVRTDIKEKKNEFLNDLLAAVKGGEPKAFLELFSEEHLNNLSLEDYDRVINRLSVEEADNLLNSIENKQLREKIRQNFRNNITDERYTALLIEANTNNNFSTLFEIYDPDFEHLQSFSKEQNQGLISELETPGINKLLNGINNVDVKENMRQTFEKDITSEQYESLLINSIKSNDFESFFNIFDPNADNLKNVQFKYQSLLLNNKAEVNKFLSYVKTINSSSYYFLNNNFNKAQKILTYIDQNSNNEALKEYKDNYIYLDLSLDELKQYKEFYDYVKKKNFVNKEISFDDIISQITSEGNGKLVFQVLADYDFNKLYDNYDEKYQAAIAVTEYINSYCEFYGIEDTTVIKDTDMKQIIQYVSSAYNEYMEENAAKTIIDSKTQVVSIVGDNERKGEFVVRDFVSVLDYIKQDRNKRSFFTFDTDVDCEQLKADFLNKLITLSEQNPNQHIFINIHAHGYPGGFVVSDSVRIITEELTDTLIQMHNNGVNLSNVTIGFNSCNTYFSSTEIYNRLKEANIENLPVIYAEAGFETKLGFSKGSVYGEETYLYTTLLNNLKNNNGKKVVVSDFYDVQADITWANPTLFIQLDNDSFDKLDKQLSAVISKYSTNTVDVSDTNKNIDDLENQEDLSPEDIEFLEGDSNYSNTAFPVNIFAYSIFSKKQNAELSEKASIWEEIVFRAVPSIVAAIYDKEGGQESFSAYQETFIYAHALSRWITNDGNVREKMSFGELVNATSQEMSKGTKVLAGIYEDAIESAQDMSIGEARKSIIDATLQAIGLHQAYNTGLINREEFESGKYDDNIIRQMLINMGITYEFVENLIDQSLFLLGYINENVKQKLFDMSVVYNALSKYNITGEQVRKTSDNEQQTLKQNNEAIINYDRNDYVTVLLIKKADGTQYSVRLALNRIKEGETDYIRTGVPDRKMFVYLSSINDDAFSTATSKYTTLEYIERITGVTIEVTDNTIIAKSLEPDTQVSLLRSKDVRQNVTSLIPKQIPAIDQQQQAEVEEIAQAKVVETIYLDESSEEIERKFKRAIENNSLIVIYPFSHTYDMDSLTDDQIYSLYFDIQNKFFELQEMLDKYLPEIDDRRGMAYILKEFIKNAFVHGNISDPSQPIYIKFIRNGFTVINSEGKVKDESTKQKRVNLSAAATLTGAHRGLQIIRDYEDQGLIKLEQEIEPGKAKGSNYYIVTAERVYEQDQDRTKIDFNNLIERVFAIIDLIEKTNNKYPKDREKSMTEAEQILTDTFTPEELEVIDLLASTIFDSIKYVNSTRNTSAVEFVNIIYSLQNGLFNDNLLMAEGDLRQHILNMLKHYVEVSKQKKGEENILVKTVKDNENILEDMADFLTDIIVKKNLTEKAKQQREQRKINLGRFIEGVQRDDSEFSAVMICSANENRSAIWHIMFENFLKRTKRKMTKVLSAGVFYDISQEVIRQTGQARVLRDDYHETLTFDERYKGVDEDIKSGFRSRYIKYLKLPKGSQPVFIVAGEQHRAQLIKLGYDPNWIFLMSEFYSDEFKTEFKQTHESLGKELEENNIFSMSEFPDPFEEQILRQDLPELVRSMVDYVFKTRDDIIRETLPAKFTKFTDDYNQFEHMDELPSFAFTDTERREAAREFYEDDISALDREKNQFEFRANTKYLYVLQNRNNKDALLDVVSREDAELKFKLLALMYLVRMRRGLTQEETNVMTVARDKIITEFKKQLENNSFKVSNNFDLRSYMMGIYLLLKDDSLNNRVPEIIYNAFIINTDGVVLANSDGYFAAVDLFTIVHELTHVVVSKPGFYSKLVADTVDELVSYVTPNMFLSMAKLSLKAYSKVQTGYTMHQTKGVIDYVKMGKKLHVLYNLFSDKTIDRDLRQEEHSAPIAFLELLFNAYAKAGKMVDWGVLLEAIKTIDDENLDQASMFADVLDTYIKMLVAKDKLTKQEADNLINEIEKMQTWTLLTYDIVQNIKVSDSETYTKILGNKSAVSFEEQILTKPAETKEQLKKIADVIKSKKQLSKNDLLTLLIIDVISIVDYEQLINNFDGVTEGIMNSIKIAAEMFDMQKGTYSLSEYEQISNYVMENYTVTQNSNISVIGNIFDFIANGLDQLFFAELLINQVFGTKNLSSIMKDKKLLIVTSKQQEETLQQVLQNNGTEDIKTVTMEIITEPAEGIRSDMVLDVQKGIKAKYDTEENKLIIYSKQGIDISMEEIQSLIMQEYFAERSEDIVEEDVIAFAEATDTTLDDITNRLKTAYTASVTMPNKDTKFDISSRSVSNIVVTCNQEFKSTGIKTFVITDKQAKQFASEIKSLKEQGFRFIISCKSDSIVDITDYDGLIIDAAAIPNIDQAIKFMESIKKKVLTQGVAKQISVKFNDGIYSQFEHLSIDIFNNFGIIPVMNADNIRKVGKYEVENVTENNIDNLLRSNNVIGLVINNARVFAGKKSIIKQLFSKEHKYNKGYNASLSSKFDYICYDVPALAYILNIDINEEEDLNRLRNIDLSKLGLSSDALTYLEYLQKKDNCEEMAGFIRGIAMNSARVQIINALKEKGIELNMDKFVREANGKYQKAFLTVAVQLMIEGIDITKLLETDFIDSDMTTKQYLDSVFEKVNINIEDILKNNEYRIQRTENTAKTIEDFKNYVVLLDNLKILKETSANFDMSVKAVRSMLAAA